MPEVLRDLVVTLSLQSDNFSRNINSINRQIREAESAFRLAGAGIQNYSQTTDGMASRLSMLQTNLGRQRDAVQQYERALATANSRLQESHARYADYSSRLDEARQRHQALEKSFVSRKGIFVKSPMRAARIVMPTRRPQKLWSLSGLNRDPRLTDFWRCQTRPRCFGMCAAWGSFFPRIRP